MYMKHFDSHPNEEFRNEAWVYSSDVLFVQCVPNIRQTHAHKVKDSGFPPCKECGNRFPGNVKTLWTTLDDLHVYAWLNKQHCTKTHLLKIKQKTQTHNHIDHNYITIVIAATKYAEPRSCFNHIDHNYVTIVIAATKYTEPRSCFKGHV